MKILKTEIKKALDTPGFWLSLLIGFSCVFYKNYLIIKHDYYIYNLCKKLGLYLNLSASYIYDRWIIGYLDSSTLYIFYFLGIIAALPYGISYLRDKKSGLIKNICTRCNKNHYLMSKYTAVYVAGGLATAFPILLDLLMAFIYYPYQGRSIEGSILNFSNVWGYRIIEHPYLYAGIYILIWFLFGGAMSTISLMASVVADNVFTVQLTPFFVMLALFYLPSLLPARYSKYFPYCFLSVMQEPNPVIALIVSLIMAVATFSAFMMFESRKDIL